MKSLRIIAAALLVGATALAQEAGKDEKGAAPAVQLTDAEAGALGTYAVDKLDLNPSAEDLEKGILEKIEAIKKGGNTVEEKKSEPSASGKNKKRKKAAGKEGGRKARKGKTTTSDTLKNGLTDEDRLAFGKFIVQEINANHRGQALFDAVKKEIERLRSDRAKATQPTAKNKKKRKKGES